MGRLTPEKVAWAIQAKKRGPGLRGAEVSGVARSGWWIKTMTTMPLTTRTTMTMKEDDDDDDDEGGR